MKDKLMHLAAKLQILLMEEDGQDLIEYALVVALIGFSATAGMHSLGRRHQYCLRSDWHHARHLHHLVLAFAEGWQKLQKSSSASSESIVSLQES